MPGRGLRFSTPALRCVLSATAYPPTFPCRAPAAPHRVGQMECRVKNTDPRRTDHSPTAIVKAVARNVRSTPSPPRNRATCRGTQRPP
ncbi:hypothetical protein DFJ74DRAFT_664186 [Hyaloraphidium curvatum]|nr:hypothetical protein DFJ74DRAFT_664186 [Hyaloraphidium curvatum]